MTKSNSRVFVILGMDGNPLHNFYENVLLPLLGIAKVDARKETEDVGPNETGVGLIWTRPRYFLRSCRL